ncbi:MAG: carbohydrate kinase family protein [Anaerolineae bacterium]|nr:carbohydrate kinase family protein [Anaerolineae bacterium]
MDILISGSIGYDYLMRFPGRFANALVADKLDKISVSFLVEDMTRHFGGVAANIAYTLARLGARPRLMGAAGQDFDAYRVYLEGHGVDTSTVMQINELFTASFFCNTDQENNQIASFYAGAMARAGEYAIADVTDRAPDYVVISPDDPAAMLRRVEECMARGIPYLFDPSQQVARLAPEVLRLGAAHAHMLMCNEYEWEVIQQNTALSLAEVTAQGTIFINTLGADGARLAVGDEVIWVPAVPPQVIADPTGAGDAFRAGVLRGFSLGLPWPTAVQMGHSAEPMPWKAWGRKPTTSPGGLCGALPPAL